MNNFKIYGKYKDQNWTRPKANLTRNAKDEMIKKKSNGVCEMGNVVMSESMFMCVVVYKRKEDTIKIKKREIERRRVQG